ncbi:hypothetical protein JCM8547_005988 [Rhodosporidiobolus lusitaniae]
MDGPTLTGTVPVGMNGLSKRWSSSELFSRLEPPSRPLSRTSSSTATKIRISPVSSAATSRAPSPVSRGPSPQPPFLYRRNTPSPQPPILPSTSAYSLSRRLSQPLIDAAYSAAKPSTYITFLRSLHPSLLFFFLVSVSAVISNKFLLRGFFEGLTYALTAFQMACATLGTMVGEKFGVYRATRVPTRHNRTLVMCALVFSLEILASNLALRLVPVPFHVSLRACSPILTLLLSVLFFSSSTTLRTSSSLLLVILGATFTSYHEEWASTGSLLLLASVVLLSSKSLLVTHFLTAPTSARGLALHPLDILARISPLSMLHCALFAVANGEVTRFLRFVRSSDFTRVHLAEILLNGVLSFALVPAGILAEKKTKAPALAVTTHAAQATTILASLLVFGLRLSFLNFLGVAISLAGGVIYATYDARDTEERERGLGTAAGAGGGGGGKGELLPTMVRRTSEKKAPD